jgi:phosphoribosylformylglycinamidine synthase subunit PurSL
MPIRIEVGYREQLEDPEGRQLIERARAFLAIPVRAARCVAVYLIDAPLSESEVGRVRDCFTDAVTHKSAVDRLDPKQADFVIRIGLKPGVTDAVGNSARWAIQDLLGRPLEAGSAVYTSRLFLLSGVDRPQAQAIASELLANTIIEQFEVQSLQQYLASKPDRNSPAVRSTHRPEVRAIQLGADDKDLMAISRDRILALSLAEMKSIRQHYARSDVRAARAREGLGPEPTDVELECLAQTWSEHCKHKIFNARIRYYDERGCLQRIDSLFEQHIRGATEAIRAAQQRDGTTSWLVSVFDDNAGVIAFNDQYHLVYKVETHNSPSALDPYGGAMTGILGVNRDTFGTGLGAELLANVWGYCLANPRYSGPLPRGLMHPRRVRDGVHRGVIDGGNQSGVAYARGWEVFDERFLGKPLVFCGTVGRMPVQSAGRPTHRKRAVAGDRIVMCGGRIGKDGIHGATFSSTELSEASPAQAVQIGDPITQKRMFDFLTEARELGMFSAITDNGAGGLSSSVGELCRATGGARLELSRAPLKYGGLDPWEVLVSEAQERMTLAVPPPMLGPLLQLAARREVQATDLGEFTQSGLFEVTWNDQLVARLSLAFLHEGLPTMHLTARWTPPHAPDPSIPDRSDWSDMLEALLRSANLASGEHMARHYDHEVKGLTVVRPFVGLRSDIASDASVLLIAHGSREGVVLSEGINPFYSDIDTRWMTASVVDEAVRKAVGTGARMDHMAGLDNYCWPDPVQSDNTPDGEQKLAQLVRSTMALAEFCQAYGVPCISGKDSMKNDSRMGGVKISVPPTLLFSVVAKIDDVTRAVSLDAKSPGAVVFLLGTTREELGASELCRQLGLGIGSSVPTVRAQQTLPLYRALEGAIRAQFVESCHSPTKGGLAVALAKVAMGGEVGLCIDLDADPCLRALSTAAALFSESNGRFVVTVAQDKAGAFETRFAGLACSRVGSVSSEPNVRVQHRGRRVVDCDVMKLKAVYKEWADGA